MLAAAYHSWLKRLFRVLEREPACRRSWTRTFGLEPLEDRTLLSTFFVVNAGDTGTGCANHGDPRYGLAQSNPTPGRNGMEYALPATRVGTGYSNTVAGDIINPGADGKGRTGTATVIEPNLPRRVAVTAAPPTSVAENTNVSASGTFSDFDGSVILTASEGTVSQNNRNGTWSWSEAAPLSDGSHTVTITAKDCDGATSSTHFTFTVTEVAPTVAVTTAPPSRVAENTNVSASGTFSDFDDAVTITASEGSINQTGYTSGTWSWSETAPLSDGSHTVTITATNSDGATSSTNFTFTVTDVVPSVAFTGNSGLVEVNAGRSLSLTGFFTDLDGGQGTGTVNYGDGSGVQPIALAPNTTFTLDHTYQQEGSYLVTVEITGEGGASGFASILIEVFSSGVDLTQSEQATANSPTINAPGVTATLDTTSATASLLLAPITPSVVEQLGGGAFQAEGLGTFVSAYDIRSVDVTAQDKVVMTFQFPPGRGMPALEYFDSSSQSFKPVLGSTLQPSSFVIDPVRGTITLVLDESSTPRLTDLTRTVFVVSIPQAQFSPSFVSPPPSLPLVSELSVATEAATTGTAIFSSLTATGLLSGTSSPITPANIETALYNSSVNVLSAFSPFIFFTPLHSETSGGEANAGAEANLFVASLPDILSLLNRLPPAPPSENRFTPPASEPRGVLSPSRASFPEGADGAKAPGQAPAPITPRPANNPPPFGLRFRPTGHETRNGPEMKLDKDRPGEASWLEEALSELFERLTWRANSYEEENARVHPAVAVLVLCAQLVPHAAQRSVAPSRSREE